MASSSFRHHVTFVGRQARQKAILSGERYSNLVHRELRPQTSK